MIKLMRLELKRNKIRTYLLSAAVSFLVIVGFIYLFAYVPQFDPNDTDLLLFVGYENVLMLSTLISMAIFCVLSSVMYTRFIIEEYAGKRAILLFSYPVSRKRILFAKLAVVFLFTIIAMIICNLLGLGVFSITESISPMVTGTLTTGILLNAIKGIIMMAVIAASLSIMAAGIGFIKKSVPTTIVSAVVMVSVLCNLMSGALTNSVFLYVLTGISLTAALFVSVLLMGKVNNMEVE